MLAPLALYYEIKSGIWSISSIKVVMPFCGKQDKLCLVHQLNLLILYFDIDLE